MRRFVFGCAAAAMAVFVDPSAAQNDPDWAACVQTADLNRTVSACTTILRRNPPETPENQGRAYSNRGYAQGQLGRHDAAIADLDKAVGLFPTFALAYANRAQVYLAKGDSKNAIESAGQAIRADPKNATGYLTRGHIHAQLGQYDKTVADSAEAIRVEPKNPLGYYNRGVAHYQRGDMQAAIGDYTKTVQFDPNYAMAYYNRGLAYSRINEDDRARADHTQTIRLNPNYAPAFAQRGFVNQKKGDLDTALADFNAALRINPKDATMFAARGDALMAKRDYVRAIASYDESLRIVPQNADALINRGLCAFNMKEYDRAIADYDRALAVKPDYAIAFNNRGYALEQRGDLDRAEGDYSNAVRLDPKYGTAILNRGKLREKRRRYDQALADYDAVLKIAPASPDAFQGKGDVLLAKRDYARAIEAYTGALRLSPQSAPAFEGRGKAFLAQENHGQAMSDFQAALDIDASRTEADKGLKASRLALGIDPDPKQDLAAVEPPANQSNDSKTDYDVSNAPFIPSKPPVRERENPQAAVTPPRIDAQTPGSSSGGGGRGEVRIALVIGNSAYGEARPLPNPKRDAAAVAEALGAARFDVTVKYDLDRADLLDALDEFSARVGKADWAVVYFAGHGIELSGTNYLIPIDAKLKFDRKVRDEAIALDRVMEAIEGARKLKLVVLDACRDNPFSKDMKTTTGETRSISRGLARVEPSSGMLVAFAARDGQQALDGDREGNSPFVSSFVARLGQPGVEINKVFRLVRDDVLAATSRKQEPFVYGSLPGEDFFFKPPEN